MTKKKKAVIITSTILGLLLIIYIYLFAFSLKSQRKPKGNAKEFNYDYDDADGFIDGNFLNIKNKLVGKNNKFELYLDETTTYFYIKDINSGEIIESNPRVDDPLQPTGSTLERQKSTIDYRYFNDVGVRSNRQYNYSKSISHKKTAEINEGHRTYKIKEIENGFQVYYKIVDLNIDHLYFPYYLTADQILPIIEDRTNPHRRAILNGYTDVPDGNGLYKAQNYEGMTQGIIDSLFNVFYVEEAILSLNDEVYTRDIAIEENRLNGYYEVYEKFSFDIAVEVVLNEKGIELTVLNNSIKEYSKAKLADITIYPHFGTAISHHPETGFDTEGYLVIPDGSGAVMNFNNGKTTSRSYSKRFYGQDQSLLPYEMAEEQQKLNIPVYGMVKENIGFAAIITEGDSMVTLNAQVSGISNDSYNKIYPNFTLREIERATIGSGWQTYGVNLWSKNLVDFDLSIQYIILTGENNNYVGVANAYKDYLIANKGLKVNETLKNKLTIEFLGAYDLEKRMLGIPYEGILSLTNYKQATEIIDILANKEINDIDILYDGITNGGLNNKFENKVNFEKSVGTKRQYTKFEEEMNQRGIEVFPNANFFSTSEYNKAFEKNRYGTKRIKGELGLVFEYHEPSRLPYKETSYNYAGDHFVINPLYYNSIHNSYNNSFKFKNLFLNNIGSNLSSSFNKYNELYLQHNIYLQEEMLKTNTQSIIIEDPLGFAIPYMDKAVNLPFESTIYSMIDYQIPLIHLVLAGNTSYTGNSINLPSTRDTDYQFMKALENGSGLKYTLTYEDSLNLLNTHHNKYMSTKYTNWIDLIEEQYNVLKENKLNTSYIVDHVRLQNNVYKTTYSNGVKVILNYNLHQVVVGGKTISSIDYIIEGGN